jgi:predicted outer membrane repeat protein
MRDNCRVSVSNSTVKGNRALSGAGFMCDFDSTLVVKKSSFQQNRAERHGGGIHANSNCKVRDSGVQQLCSIARVVDLCACTYVCSNVRDSATDGRCNCKVGQPQCSNLCSCPCCAYIYARGAAGHSAVISCCA